MLQLQRASAGSGKTYTLAKKFIRLLISIKEDGRPWRLRTQREIADGTGRIIAITFTNKATNEMKQRIVAKLAELSRAAREEVTDKMLRETAYLKDFSEELRVSPAEVGKACADALYALLNDYSSFRVSTIDSFFQTILRTFAYEANLNDSYQVEIDTDYLSTAAIDATLDVVDSSKDSSSPATFWIKVLMNRAASEGSQWNAFQKSENKRSIYQKLKRAVDRLENEEFKGVRKALDLYFADSSGSDPLASAYTALKRRAEQPLKEALAEAQKHCRTLSSLLAAEGIDPKNDCLRWFDGHLRKLPALRFDETSSANIFKPLALTDAKPLLKKNVVCARAQEINNAAEMMYEAYSLWLGLRESAVWCHWKAYSPLLPYLGLLGEARTRMNEYLESNNLIQLGETNSMLKRIIGDDDTPFIYERLGNSINHYLIDEFQDTSRMQWENLQPLLLESEGRGQDNLIIGDAKQSIYRFRNADTSLITTGVPAVFPRHQATGMSREENTNWRSDRRIVEFNNFFFSTLVARIADLGKGTLDFKNLYSNVAQYPSRRATEGYVEIRFHQKNSASSDADDDENITTDKNPEIGELISSLLRRGYRCKDIALLVDTNKQGKQIISEIVDYNASLPEGCRKIDFISEESLLVSSAEAVGIIVSVLRKMTSGTFLKRESMEESEPRRVDWNDIRSNFSFYALRHPEMDTASQIEGFLADESPEDSVNGMLSSMQTVALPALTEAITENFVPVNLRRSQAAFIAAFQDMVLEYCDSHAADIASFLFWWDSKGKSRSISSPEGTDAVQVMTVHKAKGLEFGCVIIPFASASLTPHPSRGEWRWVRPAECLGDAGLPPFIPVETTSALEATVHADIYRRYFDLYMMDRLNSAYVAFTRAVSELYIITELPRRENNSLGSLLRSICGDADPILEDAADDDYMLPAGISAWNEGGDVLTFGEKPQRKAQEQPADGKAGSNDDLIIEEYGVDSSPAVLRYVESDLAPASTLSGDVATEAGEDGGEEDTAEEKGDTETRMPEAADTDPRSEGNLLHAAMGMIKTADDLPRAILSLKTRGLITPEQAEQWHTLIAGAISAPGVRDWFSGRWKVFNERAILVPHAPDRRPDRVLLSPDRKRALIIDYKFGRRAPGHAYRKQVRDYMVLFREATGIKDIRGYIWYVRLGEVDEV